LHGDVLIQFLGIRKRVSIRSLVTDSISAKPRIPPWVIARSLCRENLNPRIRFDAEVVLEG
jgi:hypothetical protein